MTKVLVVDDVITNRTLLRQTLVALNGYHVVEAASGMEAISQFEQEKPDLILMDIMMPGTDGCQATTIIKDKMGDDYVPIIFVTALSSEDSLATALASGGDDFISKPFNVEVLASKITAHLRIRELNQQLNINNSLLLRLNQRLMNEQELIEHFFESAIKQSFLDDAFIKYHMSSLSAFNGDLLLAQRAPQGGIYLIIGDFSGHGLTAAMGTLPVAMIFFKMVEQSASVGDIAREINRQLFKLMPVSMFFVASILELNARGDIMSVWMGGNPETYWLNKDGEFKGVINAKHMPLGILHDNEFDDSSQVLTIENEDKFYLYSDGIIEAKNKEGELFGEQRLKEILLSGKDDRFDEVISQLKDFAGEDNQNDDITLVELTCQSIAAAKLPEDKAIDASALNWNLDTSLNVEDMRTPNPVSKILKMLNAMPYLSRHKGVLQILLTEIYTNSLEHGILNIESINKSDEENFVEYYKKKDSALSALESGYINFNFSFYADDNKYYLKIRVSDSGHGYESGNSATTDEMLHGRGLSIIQSFCEKVSISDDGKTLEVLYQL